jgi:hypothetical protein
MYLYEQEVEKFLDRIREGKYKEASREIAGLRLAIVPDLLTLAARGYWADIGNPLPAMIFYCAYNALESMGKIVLVPMIPLLKSDDDSTVMITAELLGSFGYPEALPHLKRALNNPEKRVREHIERAIENILNPEKDTPPDIGYPGYSWQNYPRHSYNPNE